MKISHLLIFAALGLGLSACNKPAAAEENKAPTPIVDPVGPTESGVPANTAAVNTLVGTYTSTEQGDYMHANITGEDGKDYSFFFAPDLDPARSDEMVEGLWDGKKITCTWRTANRDIPESGGMMELEEIVSIEAR